MKEVRETKLVEQTTVKFVANDGKEFQGEDAENLCREYERKNNEELVKKEFSKLGAVQISIPMANWFSDEAEFWKVPLTSKRDYIAMKDFFEVVQRCTECYMEEPKEYPHTMIAVLGYDWYDEYRNDIKADLEKALEQLNK